MPSSGTPLSNRTCGAFGSGRHFEPRSEGLDAIAVAHPHLVLLTDIPQAIEQGRGRNDVDERPPEFLLVGRDHLAAELLVKRLLAVADAEQRQAAVEQNLWSAGAFSIDDGRRAAREDDPLGIETIERLVRGVERRDLGLDAGFADATSNELRHLAAEIDDEDGFGGLDRHGEPIESRPQRVKLSQPLSDLPPTSGRVT